MSNVESIGLYMAMYEFEVVQMEWSKWEVSECQSVSVCVRVRGFRCVSVNALSQSGSVYVCVKGMCHCQWKCVRVVLEVCVSE